jgi:hypothetical protein
MTATFWLNGPAGQATSLFEAMHERIPAGTCPLHTSSAHAVDGTHVRIGVDVSLLVSGGLALPEHAPGVSPSFEKLLLLPRLTLTPRSTHWPAVANVHGPQTFPHVLLFDHDPVTVPIAQDGCVVMLHEHVHAPAAALGFDTTSTLVEFDGHDVLRFGLNIVSVHPLGMAPVHTDASVLHGSGGPGSSITSGPLSIVTGPSVVASTEASTFVVTSFVPESATVGMRPPSSSEHPAQSASTANPKLRISPF